MSFLAFPDTLYLLDEFIYKAKGLNESLFKMSFPRCSSMIQQRLPCVLRRRPCLPPTHFQAATGPFLFRSGGTCFPTPQQASVPCLCPVGIAC